MLGELSGVAKIYLVSGYTDMRRSIDGLMAIGRDAYELDPYSNSLFLFCGKQCDRLKDSIVVNEYASLHCFLFKLNGSLQPGIDRTF